MKVFHIVFFYIWSHVSQAVVFRLATGAFLVNRLDRLHVESEGPPLSVQRDIQVMYLIRPS